VEDSSVRRSDDLDQPRAAVRTVVADLVPIDGTAATHRDETLAWIDRDDPLWRTAKPAVPPEHLVAYAVLVDPVERSVLLGEHRLAGRWLPTGGHVEPGEHPADAAARELTEELGIVPRTIPGIDRRPLLLTRKPVVNVGESEGHVDVSLWFAFAASVGDHLQPDLAEFTSIRWWTAAEILDEPEAPFEVHLPRFLAALEVALDA
jgi:8-oxo-dGTP diphosphatase